MTATEPSIKLDYLPEEKVYSVGTLVYNQRQLVGLFSWLMWNDFGIMLLERIGNLNGVQMMDLGATNYQMALLGSIGGFVTPWINPWVSTWSDRHRGKYGRRRPFLLIATPIFAVLTMCVPFMPDLFRHLNHFPLMTRFFSHFAMNGAALLIGICGLIAGLFNAVVLAIFSYLYWDVVPESVLGRFQALSKNVTLIAALTWNFLIVGAAEHHMKAVYLGTGIFTLTIYMLSVWKIREGEYPPADQHKQGGAFAPIRAYFVECFSKSYFLWIFVGTLFYQLGNLSGMVQFRYLRYDLHLDLKVTGYADGFGSLITLGFGLLLGFTVGTLTDRLKPMRLMGPAHFALALVSLWAYFFVFGKMSYLTVVGVRGILQFVQGVVVGAFTVEAFPRDKLGQFCSAQAVFYQFFCNILNPAVGALFDHLQNNRLGYIWTAVFYSLAAATYLKVYHNWKNRGEHPPDVSESDPRGFEPVFR